MLIRCQGLAIVLLGVILLVSRMPISGDETGVAATYIALGVWAIICGGASLIIFGGD